MRSRLSPLARLFGAVATLGLVLAGCSSPGEIKDPTPIAGATTFSKLRIGISFDQPGLGVATATGESDGVTVGKDPKGFDVDTATYVAKALGVQPTSITWVKADPVDRENLIEQGKVDMVVSSYTINDARNARSAYRNRNRPDPTFGFRNLVCGANHVRRGRAGFGRTPAALHRVPKRP